MLLQRKKSFTKNVIKSLLNEMSLITLQNCCASRLLDYTSQESNLKVDFLFQSFLVITVSYFKVLGNMKHCILATDLALFFPNKARLSNIVKENSFNWDIPDHRYSTIQYSTVKYSAIQYNTVQYSTVQDIPDHRYSTIQYNIYQTTGTVQISTTCYTVQYFTVQDILDQRYSIVQ